MFCSYRIRIALGSCTYPDNGADVEQELGEAAIRVELNLKKGAIAGPLGRDGNLTLAAASLSPTTGRDDEMSPTAVRKRPLWSERGIDEPAHVKRSLYQSIL